MPVGEIVGELLERLRAARRATLGCADELASVEELVRSPGAERQLQLARRSERLPGLVADLAREFA